MGECRAAKPEHRVSKGLAVLQLHTPIPVETPLGDAFAHLVFDYGQEHYIHFVCFLNETGECWIFDNREIRLQPNLTMGVRRPPAVDKAPEGKKLPKPRRNNPREQREVAAIADWRRNGEQAHSNGNGHPKKSKT
jgi:hypothetical protein